MSESNGLSDLVKLVWFPRHKLRYLCDSPSLSILFRSSRVSIFCHNGQVLSHHILPRLIRCRIKYSGTSGVKIREFVKIETPYSSLLSAMAAWLAPAGRPLWVDSASHSSIGFRSNVHTRVLNRAPGALYREKDGRKGPQTFRCA